MEMSAKYGMSVAASFFSPDLIFSVAAGSTDCGLGMGLCKRTAESDDRYVWGSTTKMFTAAQVLQLVDAGIVSLDHPLADYVDTALVAMGSLSLRELFDDHRISKVRVSDALHMSSGIGDYEEHDLFDVAQFSNRSKTFGPAEILDRFVPRKLAYEPGSRQSYSSTNYLLLGVLLAGNSQTTRSWRELDQKLAIPSEQRPSFNRTSFANEGTCAEQTVVHGFIESGVKPTLPAQDVLNVSCAGGWTAGNLVAPTADVARFAYELYSNSGVVSANALAKMIDFGDGRSLFKFYGMGTFSLDWSVGPLRGGGPIAYGHVGDTYGYQSQVTYFPEYGFSLAVATNIETKSQAQPADTTCQGFHAVLAALKGAVPSPCRFVVMGRFVGSCVCDGGRAAEHVLVIV